MAKPTVREGAKIYDTAKMNRTGNNVSSSVIHHRPYDHYVNGYYGQLTHEKGAGGKYVKYWERRLLMAIMYALPLELPEEWSANCILPSLIMDGYVGVADVNGFGIVANPARLAGHDVYWNPTRFYFGNPLLTPKNPTNGYKIGKTGEVLRFSHDFMGLSDTITYYAESLSKATSTLNMNLVGCRLTYAVAAAGAKSAKTIKAMMVEADNEDPLIVVDTDLYNNQRDKVGDGKPWQSLFAPVKQSWIAPEAQEVIDKLWLSACRAIGIPTPYEKAEHTIGSENAQLNVMSGSVLDVCMDNLEDSIARVKKLYPKLNIKLNREEALYNVSVQSGADNGAEPSGV